MRRGWLSCGPGWSQADAGTYRAWLEQAGLQVTAQEFVPEGPGGHELFWASPAAWLTQRPVLRTEPVMAPGGRLRPGQVSEAAQTG